jgi:Domain of unknown function (DUF6602)
MPKIELKELFLGLQEELATTLRVNRSNVPHPTLKGDASELKWVEMLKKYLPQRYEVERACVLDADGNLSDQIDIVIFDRQYCPLLFNHDGVMYVPAESVYAVFEVKQTFNKGMVEYAGAKAASVRKLRRTSIAIPHAGGTYSPKRPFDILGGLVTLDSDWKPPLGEPLLECLCALEEDHRLDIGCSLKHGSFEMLYPEDAAPQYDQSEQETALVFFMMRLLQRLQQLGTVPAIDLREYSAIL